MTTFNELNVIRLSGVKDSELTVVNPSDYGISIPHGALIANQRWLDGNKANAQDMDGHAISHLGWGLNPQGRWDAIALNGADPVRHHAGARCFAGPQCRPQPPTTVWRMPTRARQVHALASGRWHHPKDSTPERS